MLYSFSSNGYISEVRLKLEWALLSLRVCSYALCRRNMLCQPARYDQSEGMWPQELARYRIPGNLGRCSHSLRDQLYSFYFRQVLIVDECTKYKGHEANVAAEIYEVTILLEGPSIMCCNSCPIFCQLYESMTILFKMMLHEGFHLLV